MEKKISINSLEKGLPFTFAGREWTKYAEVPGKMCFAIMNGITCIKTFDCVTGTTNYRKSDVKSHLEDYILPEIREAMEPDAKYVDVLQNIVFDLTADDGTKCYGNHIAQIGLLTAEEFRAYHDYIPSFSEQYFLCTAVTSRSFGIKPIQGEGCMCAVTPSKTITHIAKNGAAAIRPVIALIPQTQVTVEKDYGLREFENRVVDELSDCEDLKLENHAKDLSCSQLIYRHVESGSRFQMTIIRLEDAEDEEEQL